MDPALKQRLVGAIVLVALAVIFLPMLIQGPAPESGAADVALDVPPQPAGDFETREIPLVTPGAAPAGGALGMEPGAGPDVLPTVDAGAASAANDAADGEGIAAEAAPTGSDAEAGDADMFPPPTAGGDYAVSFGSFTSEAAANEVVAQLRASQLPGYRERAEVDGWAVHRVRIGPYASRADAEAARLRAAHVRDDVGAQVIALDASVAAADDADETDAPTTEPAAKPAPTPAPKPAVAADTGFAVQLGAFRDTADAEALRNRVRAAGFGTFTEQVRTDEGVLTRVLVGPTMDRAAAEQLQAQLKARFGIDGLVRSHP